MSVTADPDSIQAEFGKRALGSGEGGEFLVEEIARHLREHFAEVGLSAVSAEAGQLAQRAVKDVHSPAFERHALVIRHREVGQILFFSQNSRHSELRKREA